MKLSWSAQVRQFYLLDFLKKSFILKNILFDFKLVKINLNKMKSQIKFTYESYNLDMPVKFTEINQNVSYQPDWSSTWKAEPCKCAPAAYGGMLF